MALEAGYRHIDTAYLYRNESIIGDVLQDWFERGRIRREEIFITTKNIFTILQPWILPESRTEVGGIYFATQRQSHRIAGAHLCLVWSRRPSS